MREGGGQEEMGRGKGVLASYYVEVLASVLAGFCDSDGL